MDIKDLLLNSYIEFQQNPHAQHSLRSYKREVTVAAQNAMDDWSPKCADSENPFLFQFIDFFSGCGGMSLGFHSVSLLAPFFKPLGGCDIDPEAAQTYEKNFHAPGIVMDIRSLTSEEAFEYFLRKLPEYDKNKPLVVIGCPPCQGFTTHRKRKWNSEEDDERNNLVGIFASLAVKLNPVCIVMENVPEMLSKKYWGHYEQARDIFNRAGYIVHQSVYNAAGFAVPQERFRTILIAMRRDFLLPNPLIVDPKEYVTVRQAIGQLPRVDPGQIDPFDKLHLSANHRKSTVDTIRAVPKDGGNRPFGVGPKCLDRIKGFSDVYGRLYWDRPSITITHYARNPASGRFVHPEQDRGLTIREAAFLQSFPKGFEFSGSFDSIFKQIGEAVPPKLACGVAASVLVELLSASPTDQELEDGIKSITEPISSSYSSVIAGIKASSRRQR